MPDSYIQVPLDSTGKKVDTTSLDVGASTVYRQRIVIADNSATAQFATVTGGALLVAGTFNVSGTASVVVGAGTANIGAVSLGAGTANIGFLNNISATVIVAGVVSLGAGTNLIGAVSNAAGTALMGAVSLAAGTANIGFINNISATVVTGLSYVTEKTTNSQVQVGDSANAAVRVNVVADVFATAVTAEMSASHGPKCVTASSSANVTLVASPGAGKSVYITQLMVTNASGTACRARVGTSSSLLTVVGYMAASGGGFVLNFDPPWKVSASEAALCSVKPNASQVDFTVNFYVAS